MKANLASALVPTRRSTESAVPARSSAKKHHAEHGALGRVHRGFLQLRRHHFAEVLEAADIDLYVRSIVLHRFA
jgi:addiction module HigA family antidote